MQIENNNNEQSKYTCEQSKEFYNSVSFINDSRNKNRKSRNKNRKNRNKHKKQNV